MMAILISRSSYWHFGSALRTVCGISLEGLKTIIRERPASDGKICSKCTKWVGEEMMYEYLGSAWVDEPTMKELRGFDKRMNEK